MTTKPGIPDCISCFRGEYRFLSNFYPAKIQFDNIAYNSSEAAYQAQKLALWEERRQFSDCYADEAKRLGQKVPVRPDWEDVKAELMEQILYAKFTQNPHLARLLTATGSTPLLEGNKWGDTYWGVDRHTLEGENRLGKLLMALRQRFQTEGIPDNSGDRPVRRYAPGSRFTVTDEDISLSEAEAIVVDADAPAPGYIGSCRFDPGHTLLAFSPVYGRDDEALLAECYKSCLSLAEEKGLCSIAFPILAAEKHCFPKRKATHIALSTVRRWQAEHGDCNLHVTFACGDHRIYALACEEADNTD